MSYFIKENPANKTALLIIDVQERIINPINDKETKLKNIYKLLKAYEILGQNIYLSEQNPIKLGHTISKFLPNTSFKIIKKMDFSISNSEELNSDLSTKDIKQLIVCGFETHICVLQSVLGFLKNNYKVYIAADSMGSRNIIDHDIAIERMILEGAKIASSESIIFELCETSKRNEFKEISKIIKNN
mgnify:CR=1 FL=1|tara:strand:+ start:180 stop:740 length:561 start_codon:yes stop_codon:yes gene_type:complete